MLGDPSLVLPTEKEINEAAKLDPVHVLPASCVTDEKPVSTSKHSKLTVSDSAD